MKNLLDNLNIFISKYFKIICVLFMFIFLLISINGINIILQIEKYLYTVQYYAQK